MNIDRIISIVRNLKEEGGMTTGSSGPIAGLSASADPKIMAGYDKPMFDGRSKIARRLPPPYKTALLNSKKKKNRK